MFGWLAYLFLCECVLLMKLDIIIISLERCKHLIIQNVYMFMSLIENTI